MPNPNDKLFNVLTVDQDGHVIAGTIMTELRLLEHASLTDVVDREMVATIAVGIGYAAADLYIERLA